jgi:cytochrome c oxidase assembly factor CtaG
MVVALDLSPFDIVTRIGFHPAPLLFLAGLTAWYRLAVARLNSQGRRWPPARSGAFALAIVLLAVATLSGLTSFDKTSFSVNAVQQLGVFMLAPVALCLSAPLTLAIEGASGASGARLRRWITGTPGLVLYNPALTWAVFAAAIFTLYLSHQYAWALAHAGGLDLVDLELLVVGCLFVWPVMGADPRPRSLAIGWRMLYVLLCVVYYSILGLAMESLALWRRDRRAAALADVRARESVNVRSRPAGTERSDRSAQSARSWPAPDQPAATEVTAPDRLPRND